VLTNAPRTTATAEANGVSVAEPATGGAQRHRGEAPAAVAASGDVARARRFAVAAKVIFALALASFVLSFVHRTAPAAIAGELTQAFSISAAVLGTLAATYFYVYTLLQIPVGVAADTLGPRRILTAGSAIAAVGSLLFALAPAWEIAAVGRTLVGIGVSVAFIAVLKVSAVWFAPERFATLAGVTMFAGNLGAVAAGAPLAWAVTLTSWRVVFVALAAASAALALATWLRVRDSPQELGFAPLVSATAPTARVPWMQALARVLGNRGTWPAFIVNAGVGGSYLAFAGLWGVPYLQQVYAMPRVAAAQHTSLLLLGVAFGSLAIGMISDRLRSRSGVMRAFVIAYTLSWLPWLLAVQWPMWATLAWFFLMGLLIPGFTLSWTIAKESNPPQYSGIATSVVNVGIFLGTGILQPLVGWVLDRGRAAGDLAGAWERGVWLMAGAAAVGAVMTLFVDGRRAQ
jgi:predicted MFS family arabinose efflux permease